MNHDFAYVANKIGKSENWVKRHAPQLPHHKFGRSYAFDDEDIAEIIEQAKVRPAPRIASTDGELRPSGYRRSA